MTCSMLSDGEVRDAFETPIRVGDLVRDLATDRSGIRHVGDVTRLFPEAGHVQYTNQTTIRSVPGRKVEVIS